LSIFLVFWGKINYHKKEAKMDEAEVFEKVKKIAVEILGADEKNVLRTVSYKSLGADSLDTVELVLALEEEFGLEIPDDEAEKIITLGDAVKYVFGRKSA